MSMLLKTQIQLRNDTAAKWASVNPKLAKGEIGIEIDTNKIKIGNGTDLWNDLPYFGGELKVDGKSIQLVDGTLSLKGVGDAGVGQVAIGYQDHFVLIGQQLGIHISGLAHIGHAAPAVVAHAGAPDGFAVAQGGDDLMLRTGAGADIDAALGVNDLVHLGKFDILRLGRLDRDHCAITNQQHRQQHRCRSFQLHHGYLPTSFSCFSSCRIGGYTNAHISDCDTIVV